jgi:endonuclease YncB( thermonuclease family)
LLKKLCLIFGVCFFLSQTFPLWSKDIKIVYTGKAEKISDGDTITLLTNDYERIKVRFYGIDAPEKKQPSGPQATEALKRLIDGRELTVEEVDTDRYSRVVGLVRLGDQLINLTLIEEGWAWLYPNYCRIKDVCQAMAQAEKTAQSQAAGLWRDQNPVPPWRWRKGERAAE